MTLLLQAILIDLLGDHHGGGVGGDGKQQQKADTGQHIGRGAVAESPMISRRDVSHQSEPATRGAAMTVTACAAMMAGSGFQPVRMM